MANEVEIRISDKFISRGGFGQARKQVGEVDGDVKNLGKSVDGLAADFDRAGTEAGSKMRRSISKGLDGIEGDVKQAGKAADGLASDFDQAGDEAGTRLRRSLKSKLDGVDGDVKGAGKKAGDSFSEGIGQGVESGGGGIESKLGGLLEGIGKGGAIAAAGAAAGAFFMEAFNQHMAKDAAKGQVKAEFGLTESEAKNMGKEAGDLYYSGVGESIGDNAQVIGRVKLQFKDLATEGRNSADDITKGALGISKVFDQDVNEVLRATSAIMKNGLAPDAKTALDIITSGFQNGANLGDDFLDTITEYSPYFKQLGLSAQDGIGLVSQMLQAGARDADYAADAIKEFGIRAIDGSKPVSQAFKDLGFDAAEMSAKIGQGGPAAREAFGQVITALQGIEDPIARNNAGVALFGTQWEDTVRAVLPNIDLAKAGAEGVAGATDKMNKSISETDTSKLDTLGRKFSEAAGAAADFATKTNKMEYTINFDANMGMAQGQLDGFIGKVNTATPQVNINGNTNNAVAALEQVQHEIDAGHGTVLIDGNPMDAQAAKDMIIASINDSAGTVTINGETYPAGTKLNELLGNVNASQAAISVTAYTALANEAIDWAARNRTSTIFVETVGSVNGNSVVHSRWSGGNVGAAASGGARGSMTLVGEQGPELVRLPFGSTVLPNGQSRSILDGYNDSSYDFGSIPAEAWKALMAAGWKGNPNDGAERIYKPNGYMAPSPQKGDGQRFTLEWAPGFTDDGFMAWLKNAIRVRGGDPRVLGN